MKFIVESQEEYQNWIQKSENSDQKLKKLSDDHSFHKLDQDEQFGIHAYTRHSYDLNKAHADTGDKAGVHEKLTDRLDKVLHRHTLPSSLHVYSGMGPNRTYAVRNAAKEGKHLHLPAYTSTSTSKHIGSVFSRTSHEKDKKETHMLHVHLPKGHAGLYIDKGGQTQTEQEFLLPRHTKLKIHPKPTVFETDTHKHHIWHATPV